MKRKIIALSLAILFIFSSMSVYAETVSRLIGDVNGDNEIGAIDYLMVKRYCFGTYDMNFVQEAVADVDKSGAIDEIDYLLIKRHCLSTYSILGRIDTEVIPAGAIVANLIAGSQDEEIMAANTVELQACVDQANANGGGTVYIPSGTYYFSSQGPNARNVEEYVCMPKDNVLVMGAGRSTVLMPVGVTERGLDMFYFNEYADSGFTNPKYLINADFRDLVIDGQLANAEKYTSAGKGFMINLFKDCDYDNVVVKNTDGTGFGMDCPINCTITNCEAYNNGKLATTSNAGASGFGIGTGYIDGESILIENCYAEGNKKFGFFFEHQGRFQASHPERYTAQTAEYFLVRNCVAKNNYYDFGGELAYDVVFRNCRVPADSTSNTRIIFRHHSVNCFAYDMDVEAEFTDVSADAEYYDAVYWAVNRGITTGTSTTAFSPDNTCSIASALTFLHRFAGYPGDLVLNNISDATYYEYALKWAVSMGMVASDVTVSNGCTYDDIIKYMWIYAGEPEASGSYDTHVNWALQRGIISEVKTGTVIRADVVTMFYNYENSK